MAKRKMLWGQQSRQAAAQLSTARDLKRNQTKHWFDIYLLFYVTLCYVMFKSFDHSDRNHSVRTTSCKEKTDICFPSSKHCFGLSVQSNTWFLLLCFFSELLSIIFSPPKKFPKMDLKKKEEELNNNNSESLASGLSVGLLCVAAFLHASSFC